MNLRTCYETMGADYDDVMTRLRKEERVQKILFLFLKDTSFQDLEKALNEKNWSAAFLAAHTIKGVCMNLSLTPLIGGAVSITELLRGGTPAEDPMPLFEPLRENYRKVCDVITQFQAQCTTI